MGIMPESEPPYPHELESLPASCEVIWLILANAEEPLTQKQLCEETARPSKTVQYALGRLRDETDLLDERPAGDARQSHYTNQRYTRKRE